jgi:outer membrane beta-barrel protein
MQRIRKLTVLAAATLAAVTLLPDTAQAKRKSPLEGKPVVVRKLELRKLRFGITPFVGMSLSQTFVHKGYVGGRLHFDFTDWIGIQAKFAYGIINRDAKLLRALTAAEGGLPVGIAPGTPENPGVAPIRSEADFNSPAPLLHDFKSGLTRNDWLASADIVFKPFSGKLGLFSGIFTEYDMYLFGGLGIAGFGRHYKDARSTSELLGLNTNAADANYCRDMAAGNNVDRECFLHPVKDDSGVKLGPSFGGGVNIFLADFAALNLDIHDIVTRNNAAGLNATTTEDLPTVDKADRNWNHNVMFSIGVSFYLPPKAKRSELKPAATKTKTK